MNAWMVAAYAVGACLLPCAHVCLRGSPERRLVGLEMTSTITAILLALLAVATHRLVLMDLPLTVAMLALGGGLVFARFLERHL